MGFWEALAHVPQTLVGLPPPQRGKTISVRSAVVPSPLVHDAIVCLVAGWLLAAGWDVRASTCNGGSTPTDWHVLVGHDVRPEEVLLLPAPYVAVVVDGLQSEPTAAVQVFLGRAEAIWVSDMPQYGALRGAPFVMPAKPMSIVPLLAAVFLAIPESPRVNVLPPSSSSDTTADLGDYSLQDLVATLTARPAAEVVHVQACERAPFGTRLLKVLGEEDHARSARVLQALHEWPGTTPWLPLLSRTGTGAKAKAKAEAEAETEAGAGAGAGAGAVPGAQPEAGSPTSGPAMSLCLCMIVRDEADIIENTLRMLVAAVPELQSFVIADTGSTDATPAIITRTMAELQKPGFLLRHKWHDFGTNRTLMLHNARLLAGASHLMLWDADDLVCLPPGVTRVPLPPGPPFTHDQYLYMFETGTHCPHPIVFHRPFIISNARQWRYVGVLHEYLDLNEPGVATCMAVSQAGLKFLGRSAGARSKDPNKLVRDAEMLERALAAETPGSGLWCRYLFYLGNSYRDHNDGPNAIRVYRVLTSDPRATTGWSQEKYVANLRLGVLLNNSGDTAGAVMAWLQACAIDSTRLEAVFELVNLFTIRGDFGVAHSMASLGRAPRPGDASHLFLTRTTACFDLPYVMIIVCQRTGRVDEARAQYAIIFREGHVPASDWHLNNLFGNLRFVPGVAEVQGYVDRVHALRPQYVPTEEAVAGALQAGAMFPLPSPPPQPTL